MFANFIKLNSLKCYYTFGFHMYLEYFSFCFYCTQTHKDIKQNGTWTQIWCDQVLKAHHTAYVFFN